MDGPVKVGQVVLRHLAPPRKEDEEEAPGDTQKIPGRRPDADAPEPAKGDTQRISARIPEAAPPPEPPAKGDTQRISARIPGAAPAEPEPARGDTLVIPGGGAGQAEAAEPGSGPGKGDTQVISGRRPAAEPKTEPEPGKSDTEVIPGRLEAAPVLVAPPPSLPAKPPARPAAPVVPSWFAQEVGSSSSNPSLPPSVLLSPDVLPIYLSTPALARLRRRYAPRRRYGPFAFAALVSALLGAFLFHLLFSPSDPRPEAAAAAETEAAAAEAWRVQDLPPTIVPFDKAPPGSAPGSGARALPPKEPYARLPRRIGPGARPDSLGVTFVTPEGDERVVQFRAEDLGEVRKLRFGSWVVWVDHLGWLYVTPDVLELAPPAIRAKLADVETSGAMPIVEEPLAEEGGPTTPKPPPEPAPE